MPGSIVVWYNAYYAVTSTALDNIIIIVLTAKRESKRIDVDSR